jgi:hypothetical protein
VAISEQSKPPFEALVDLFEASVDQFEFLVDQRETGIHLGVQVVESVVAPALSHRLHDGETLKTKRFASYALKVKFPRRYRG